MLRGAFLWRWLPWAIRSDIANDDKRYLGTTNFHNPKSSQCIVVFHLFRFGQFFPILAIPASAKVIVTAVHGARTTTAKLEIMDSFAFDDISTFFASDCIPDNSRHNHHLLSSLLRVYMRTIDHIPAFNNASPILFTSGTTKALPMQKYRIRSGIPVFVQSSGKPFNRSHSIGVSTRRRPVIGSCTA